MGTALFVAAAVLTAGPRPSPVVMRLLGPRLAAPVHPIPAAQRRRKWPRPGRVAVPLVDGVVLVASLAAGMPIPAAVALTILATLGTGSWQTSARLRAERAQAARLTTAMDVLHAELSAGSRESEALRAAASMTPDDERLARAADLAAMGLDIAPALSATSLSALASAWKVRAGCGAALADVVGRVAHDAHCLAARRRAAEAALAGPVSSAAMLALLPGLGIALGAAMGAHPVRFLFSPGLGSLDLLLGVCLDALGCAWIQLFVRSARR